MLQAEFLKELQGRITAVCNVPLVPPGLEEEAVQEQEQDEVQQAQQQASR